MMAFVFALGAALAASSPLHRGTAPAPSRSSAAVLQQAASLNPAVSPEGAARYHVGDSLLCSDCHTMHSSMAHDWAGGAVAPGPALDGNWLGATGPNPSLLRAASAIDVCLACHDGRTFAPDVVGADVNGLVERSAGHFFDVDAPNHRGHNIRRGLSSDPDEYCGRCHFEGTMATAAVQCVDCHAKHGNGNFRNLQWVSAPGQESEIRAYIRPGVSDLQRYEGANVRYPSPSGSEFREVTNVCIDCHHAFMDGWTYTTNDPWGSGSPFIRHPGTNSEWGAHRPINRPGANTDPANWMNEGGAGRGFGVARLKFLVRGASSFAEAEVVQGSNEVFCLTCHKAHGSEHAFGLRWDNGSPVSSAEDTNACRQCHAGAVE